MRGRQIGREVLPLFINNNVVRNKKFSPQGKDKGKKEWTGQEIKRKSKIPTLAGKSPVFLGCKGIGYISYRACQRAGDEFSRYWIFSREGRDHRKEGQLFT
jgi:hypothetical protein